MGCFYLKASDELHMDDGKGMLSALLTFFPRVWSGKVIQCAPGSWVLHGRRMEYLFAQPQSSSSSSAVKLSMDHGKSKSIYGLQTSDLLNDYLHATSSTHFDSSRSKRSRKFGNSCSMSGQNYL